MKGRPFLFTLLFLTALLFSSCGYRIGHGPLACSYQTLTLHYVDGDRGGHLTSELIHHISTSGAFAYCREGGDLLLKVEIVEQEDLPIGYRYERDRNDLLTDRVITTEGRLKAIAEVQVIDCCSGCVLMGPVRVTAAVDYDHDYYSSGVQIPVFSLGQLDDVDVARDVAQLHLDTELAGQIVSLLSTIGCCEEECS